MSGLAAEIERLAFRAWPAAEEEVLEGWTLRRSPGLRARRINSATSPIGEVGDLDRVEEAMVGWYRRRAAAPVARILSASASEVDQFFADRGWADESPTAVMTKQLEPNVAAGLAVTVSDTPTDRWLEAKQRMTAMSDTTIALWTERASAIPGGTSYAAAEDEGAVVAIGLGVVEDGWLGIFDVQTIPELRRRGLATRIVHMLEAVAVDRGATMAYLQVEMRNVPARALYAHERYSDVYSYWYRRARA